MQSSDIAVSFAGLAICTHRDFALSSFVLTASRILSQSQANDIAVNSARIRHDASDYAVRALVVTANKILPPIGETNDIAVNDAGISRGVVVHCQAGVPVSSAKHVSSHSRVTTGTVVDFVEMSRDLHDLISLWCMFRAHASTVKKSLRRSIAPNSIAPRTMGRCLGAGEPPK